MNGSTSARKTDEGLAVRCACGETFTLPKDRGEQRCACSRVHRYDGKQLVTTPPTLCRRGPGIDNPGRAPADPRVQRPPRGRANPL